ncbi:MAG: hypothetical protein J6P87_07760, partial [Lachnospiraceae bacterium]|nr:hypothetical protein [Lachnospiraceae bacterium]
MDNTITENREAPGLVEVSQKYEPDTGKQTRFVTFAPYAALFAAAAAFGRFKNPAGIACSLPVIVFFVLTERLMKSEFAGYGRKTSSMYVFSMICSILLSVHIWTSASVP